MHSGDQGGNVEEKGRGVSRISIVIFTSRNTGGSGREILWEKDVSREKREIGGEWEVEKKKETREGLGWGGRGGRTVEKSA